LAGNKKGGASAFPVCGVTEDYFLVLSRSISAYAEWLWMDEKYGHEASPEGPLWGSGSVGAKTSSIQPCLVLSRSIRA